MNDNDKDIEYCDACGEQLMGARVPFSSLPIDVASANAGESAVLCRDCHVIMIQKMEEEDPDKVTSQWKRIAAAIAVLRAADGNGLDA